MEARGIETRGLRQRWAVTLLLVTLFFYALFMTSDIGPQLYAWSKTFASYDFRQYLGMSKRYLWQYGHTPPLDRPDIMAAIRPFVEDVSAP